MIIVTRPGPGRGGSAGPIRRPVAVSFWLAHLLASFGREPPGKSTSRRDSDTAGKDKGPCRVASAGALSVGDTGFEPVTFSVSGRRAPRLRQSPRGTSRAYQTLRAPRARRRPQRPSIRRRTDPLRPPPAARTPGRLRHRQVRHPVAYAIVRPYECRWRSRQVQDPVTYAIDRHAGTSVAPRPVGLGRAGRMAVFGGQPHPPPAVDAIIVFHSRRRFNP
jgi:hypothetical protein